MEKCILNVRMLGEFSITLNHVKIDDKANRSRKVWLLLAYLIYNRRRVISQEEMLKILWESERNDNPLGALKTVLWRARRTLSALDPVKGPGLILTKEGGYCWDPEISTEVDVEVFERQCRVGIATEGDVRLKSFREALALYQGDFLNKLSAESWVEPLVAHYRSLYINMVLETVPMLRTNSDEQEAIRLCREALELEPYHETLYQHLMLSLLDMGDFKKALRVYEGMRDRLSSELGIVPDETSQTIYQEILRNISGHALPPEMIWQQLREQNPPDGALICDYAFFKLHYQAEARSAARRGDAVHIGVLTVANAKGGELVQSTLSRAMDNLRIQIREGLRRGDVASRCTTSQYVLLLLQANYEDSCMVCDRIVKAYFKAHPRSGVSIRVAVLPLEPVGATYTAAPSATKIEAGPGGKLAKLSTGKSDKKLR